MTLDDRFYFMEIDAFGQNSRVVTLVICLQQIKKITIDDDFNFCVGKIGGGVIFQEFDKFRIPTLS